MAVPKKKRSLRITRKRRSLQIENLTVKVGNLPSTRDNLHLVPGCLGDMLYSGFCTGGFDHCGTIFESKSNGVCSYCEKIGLLRSPKNWVKSDK